MRPAASRACPSVVRTAAAAAVLALAGCAAPPAAWKVQPQYRVDHAGVAPAGQGYAALARRYGGERRWAEALDAWRKAAAEAPEDAEILNGLAMAEAGQGHHANAIAALRRAVALAPQRAHLLNNLGYALMLDGQADAAREVLQQALAADPRHALARANLERAGHALALALPVPPVAAAAAQPAVVSTPPAQAQPAFQPPLEVRSVPDVAPLELAAAPPPAVRTLPTAEAPLAPVSVGAATVALLPSRDPMPVPQPLSAPKPATPEPTAQTKAPRVEIANGNGVAGLAAWTGRWLRRQGQPGTPRLANLPPYRTEATAVHYAPGWADQARALAHRLPGSVALVAEAQAPSTRADVRVVLGRDWRDIARAPGTAGPATALARADGAR